MTAEVTSRVIAGRRAGRLELCSLFGCWDGTVVGLYGSMVMVTVAVAVLSCESLHQEGEAERAGLGWLSGQDIVCVRGGRTEGQAPARMELNNRAQGLPRREVFIR